MAELQSSTLGPQTVVASVNAAASFDDAVLEQP
jgi:hypothetical protein